MRVSTRQIQRTQHQHNIISLCQPKSVHNNWTNPNIMTVVLCWAPYAYTTHDHTQTAVQLWRWTTNGAHSKFGLDIDGSSLAEWKSADTRDLCLSNENIFPWCFLLQFFHSTPTIYNHHSSISKIRVLTFAVAVRCQTNNARMCVCGNNN